MTSEEESKKAEKIAFKMLALRPRSRQEIRKRLSEKRVSASTIEEVLDHLANSGYVDDQRFAQELALRLFANKGWGFARIDATLRARGFAPELVNTVVSQLRKDFSEEETALRLLKRRFSHVDFRKASPKERNRIVLFFRQRGFSWETISRVLML